MSENVAFLAPVRRDNMELDLEAWLECYLADCEARGLTPRTLEWYRDRGLPDGGASGSARRAVSGGPDP
jgi:hypothetical protein